LKKILALTAVLLLGLILFGCAGGGGGSGNNGGQRSQATQPASSGEEQTATETLAQQSGGSGSAQPLDMNGEYCGFKVGSLTPEKIKAAGFTGDNKLPTP
jgi:hypothetical protein